MMVESQFQKEHHTPIVLVFETAQLTMDHAGYVRSPTLQIYPGRLTQS
jgi:hypothetical protein